MQSPPILEATNTGPLTVFLFPQICFERKDLCPKQVTWPPSKASLYTAPFFSRYISIIMVRIIIIYHIWFPSKATYTAPFFSRYLRVYSTLRAWSAADSVALQSDGESKQWKVKSKVKVKSVALQVKFHELPCKVSLSWCKVSLMKSGFFSITSTITSTWWWWLSNNHHHHHHHHHHQHQHHHHGLHLG